MRKCLMLGKGHRNVIRRAAPNDVDVNEPVCWITLDINPECFPNIVFDLNLIEQGIKLPFPDNYFDEIHMYEVLEHYGSQGDYEGFFAGFRELWRITKVNGYVLGTCPGHTDPSQIWGDPGHKRCITEFAICYLGKENAAQLGDSPSSDYIRLVHPYWWKVTYITEPDRLIWGLQKVIVRSE